MDRRSFFTSSSAGLILAGTGAGWSQAGMRRLPVLPLIDLLDGIDHQGGPLHHPVSQLGQFPMFERLFFKNKPD